MNEAQLIVGYELVTANKIFFSQDATENTRPVMSAPARINQTNIKI